MRNHYIPRYLLKGFVDPCDSGALWCYEIGTGRSFLANVANVAVEKQFYYDEDEEWLARNVEQPAVDAIRNLRGGAPVMELADGDRQALCRYMAVMLTRVPRNRGRIDDMAPGVIRSVVSKLKEKVSDPGDQDPGGRDRADFVCREIDKIECRFLAEPPKDVIADLKRPRSVPVVENALSQMTWRVFAAAGASGFVASDNPLFFFESLGIGQRDSEVSFPISSSVLLWLTWRKDLGRGPFRADERTTRELNRRTVSSATRHAYYHENVAWLARMTTKTSHCLNMIR